MRQKNLLFTWRPESFSAALEQPNLVELRTELAGIRLLSENLLIWEKDYEAGSWWLIDFENKKVYHLDRNSDTEIEVSEDANDMEGLPEPNLGTKVYGTSQGFIDWLTRFKSRLDEYDPEKLKRADLSVNNLSFEIVHPNLLTVYSMFQEVLTSPSEWAVGWLDNNLQQEVQTNLSEFLKILARIHYFDSHASSEQHKEVLKQTFKLCDQIQQQLHQAVIYLKTKKTEQLETKVNTTVTDAVEKLKEVTDESQKTREEAEQNETTRQREFTELKNKLEDELAKETVSKHRKIFAKQADEHKRVSRGWLIATGVLIVAFGAVFYWLFEALRLGGTELIGVLQNVFTKGFLLTLIYFVLNRSHKNYTAQKHLEVVNRHRQNALDTFDDFVESAGDNRETRDAVLLAATNAIFDANQSGYLSSKTKGTESANPIQQVVRAVLPGSSSTKPEN